MNTVKGRSSNDFSVFRDSAINLLQGGNPYGISYPIGQILLPGEFPPAQYLYSPAAGIFFFGPLAALPYAVGLFLYNSILFCVFIFAMHQLVRTDRNISAKYRNLFFLFVMFEAMGSLLNGKLEVLIASVFVYVYAGMFNRGPDGYSFGMLGIFSNFKLQPFAASGLLVAAADRTRKWAAATVLYALALVVCFVAPGIFLGSRNLAVHQSWLRESSKYIAQTFDLRVHIWRFFSAAFGWNISLGQAGALSGGVATLLFLYCVYLRKRRAEPSRDRVLRALALGGAFSVIFSPAAQSSAYILLTPLYWAYCKLPNEYNRADRRSWAAGFAVSLFFISICYSDFVRQVVREQARAGAWKALGAALLLGFYIYFDARSKVSSPQRR